MEVLSTAFSKSTQGAILAAVDPDNEQFVIYVRSKKGFKAWYPLNVVTGGSTANTLVKKSRKQCF